MTRHPCSHYKSISVRPKETTVDETQCEKVYETNPSRTGVLHAFPVFARVFSHVEHVYLR